MPRVCPDCSIDLIAANFHGIQVDACRQCAGIFFDEGEVNAIRKMGPEYLEKLDARIQPQEIPEGIFSDDLRRCPECGALMSKYRYLYASPIFLDSCDLCGGTWIQDGELKAMADYVRSVDAESSDAVVAQMQAVSHDHIQRAEGRAQALRFVSRRIPNR